MRPIGEIIAHCSATKPEWMEGRPVNEAVNEIRRWHMANGWRDIGYHYVIDRQGNTGPGRPVGEVGAHVKGHNTGTIGICLLGGHGSAETDQFSGNFTPAQDKALRELIADLKRDFSTINKVTGHNQYARKSCPGFNVEKWLMQSPKTHPKAPPAVEVPKQGFLARFFSMFRGWK